MTKLYKKNRLSTRVGMGSRILLSVAVAVSSALSSGLDTQETDRGYVLEELVVSGIRRSIKDSLGAKREAVGVSDAIFAEDFNKFPDLNIAESIQRIPGVTLNRNRGEGEQINIRGLSPSFTRVEVLGMTGATGQTDRDFRFDLFPSELFSKVEVIKSASADLAEGGLAATVRMDTAKPLDMDPDEFKGSVAALGHYSELTGDNKPRGSVQIASNRGGRFGVAFGLAHAESENVSHRVDASNWNRPMSNRISAADQVGLTEQESGAWLPRTPRFVVDDSQRERLGGTFTFQAQLNEDMLLTYDAVYVNLTQDHQLIKNDMEFESNIGAPTGLVVENGIVTAGTFPNIAPRVTNELFASEDKNVQNVLGLDWDMSDVWKIRGQIAHSTAQQNLDRALHGFAATQRSIGNNAAGDLGGDIPITLKHAGSFVNFESADSSFDIFDIDDYEYLVYLFRHSLNEDENTSLELDFAHSFGDSSSIEFGLRYEDRTKSRIESRGGVSAGGRLDGGNFPDLNEPGLASLIAYDGPGPAGQVIRINLDASEDIIFPMFPNTLDNLLAPRPRASFDVQEATLAGYIKASFGTGIFDDMALSGNVGVRLVRTESTANGTVEDTSGGAEDMPISIDNGYTRWLPALNLKLDVTDDLVIRAALSRTLARPSLSNMSPAVRIDLGTQVGSSGNPQIQPFSAWNGDLSVEWYFGAEEDAGLASIAFFRKDIESLVENITEDVTFVTCPQIGCDANNLAGPRVFQVTRPVNGNEASVTGVELAIQSNFSFLPTPLKGMGGILNYTITNSNADFSDVADVRSIQLPGLSKNSLNAVLYYQQSENFETRLAYAWRDQYIRELRNPAIWRDEYGQFDLSASYSVGNLTLQFEALNITGEPVNEFADNNAGLPTRWGEWGRKYVFGARYNF